MTRVLPSILARDEQEFRKRTAAVAGRVPMLHIDVLDGSLFPERSFANPARIASLHLSIPYGVHLMVNNPELVMREWIGAGASRIIVHIEALGNLGLALEKVRHAEREAGLALNPETDLSRLDEFVPFIQYVLVMGVHPGGMGRAYHPETMGRIRAIKQAYPQLTVGVDGGVTTKKHLAHELAVAGADELIVGSSMWNADNPFLAYQEIAADAKH
jgi:ribulose-phosphate 3-epimerase